MTTSDAQPEVKCINEWGIGSQQNLANHTVSQQGFPRFVRQSLPSVPLFRTRHAAYRYVAWLLTLAELLPDEPGQEGITYEQVLDAVQNT